jgi:hypothetical protein
MFSPVNGRLWPDAVELDGLLPEPVDELLGPLEDSDEPDPEPDELLLDDEDPLPSDDEDDPLPCEDPDPLPCEDPEFGVVCPASGSVYCWPAAEPAASAGPATASARTPTAAKQLNTETRRRIGALFNQARRRHGPRDAARA